MLNLLQAQYFSATAENGAFKIIIKKEQKLVWLVINFLLLQIYNKF